MQQWRLASVTGWRYNKYSAFCSLANFAFLAHISTTTRIKQKHVWTNFFAQNEKDHNADKHKKHHWVSFQFQHKIAQTKLLLRHQTSNNLVLVRKYKTLELYESRRKATLRFLIAFFCERIFESFLPGFLRRILHGSQTRLPVTYSARRALRPG